MYINLFFCKCLPSRLLCLFLCLMTFNVYSENVSVFNCVVSNSAIGAGLVGPDVPLTTNKNYSGNLFITPGVRRISLVSSFPAGLPVSVSEEIKASLLLNIYTTFRQVFKFTGQNCTRTVEYFGNSSSGFSGSPSPTDTGPDNCPVVLSILPISANTTNDTVTQVMSVVNNGTAQYSLFKNISLNSRELNSHRPLSIVTSQPVLNEYVGQELIFRIDDSGVEVNSDAGGRAIYSIYNQTLTASSGMIVICTRPATPLQLTLDNEISFGELTLNSLPVTRKLSWSTGGSGLAGTWTMTFEPDKAEGNNILLGDSHISVISSNGAPLALNTPVEITGTSGYFTLTLTPDGKQAGGPVSSNLNVTLSAN